MSCAKAGTTETINRGHALYQYDTYAVLEYMSGNKRYVKYFEQDTGQLTVLNLMEIYYAMLRDYGESDATKAYSSASTYKVEFDDRDAQEAMKKRLALRQKKRLDLSYADSLGYHLSLKHKIKFLTGDTAFKELENVEYVK